MSSIQNVSRNLLRLRARRGLTQNELAALAKVSNCHISMIENGVSGAKLPVVEKLARALKVEPASMLMRRTRHAHRGRKAPSLSKLVPDNITIQRLENLMTQARLAHKTGIAQMQISALERGKAMPTLTTLDRIAAGLKLKNAVQLLGKPSTTLIRIRSYVKIPGAGPSNVPAALRNGVFTWRGYQTV